jgi:predicted outer membrane repeat protein
MSEKNVIFVWAFVLGFLAFINCSPAAERVIYVDAAAAGANDGSSWENAYIYLQDALTDANDFDRSVEIRVAQGIYKPDRGIGIAISHRESTFELISNLNLKGGYGGVSSSDPNTRDIELYETILSGDLNGDDATVYDAQDMLDDVTRAENSYHVVTAINIDPNALLDGFTITGGNANGKLDEHIRGGGIFCDRSKLCIVSCNFESNSSYRFGGAINIRYCRDLFITYCEFYRNASINGGAVDHSNSNSSLTHCTFRENHANSGGAISKSGREMQLTNCIFSYNSSIRGGGLYDSYAGGVRVVDCIFTSNFARHLGGGVYNSGGTTGQIFIGCTFNYNYSTGYGGGIYNKNNCSPMIKNCLFTGNSAYNWGRALLFDNCNAEVINCTIADNYALKGGAICFGNEEYEILPSDVTITNCIFWNNVYEFYNYDLSWMRMKYCCRETSLSRMPEGCFSKDPCFIVPGWDYHLKSQAGRWDLVSESWVVDDVTSPCIDAGDPNCPVGDETEPNGGRINMGAYGGTSEASKSYSTEQ